MSFDNSEPNWYERLVSEQNDLSNCPHYALLFIDERGILHRRFSPSISYHASSMLSETLAKNFLTAVVRNSRIKRTDSSIRPPPSKKRKNGQTARSGIPHQMAYPTIPIGNENLRSFYEQAFEAFQQTNCRILAKAYIKLIEPRKQVYHPYNGRVYAAGKTQQFDPEATKPSWWPSSVTHREPDHLLKPGMENGCFVEKIAHTKQNEFNSLFL